MVVLVTGGTGFMGRHLVRALRERGDRVVVVGRRSSTGLPEDVAYEQGDLAAESFADRLIRRLRPQRVFHLASAVNVKRDLQLLDDQVRNTQLAAVYVARACLEGGVRRLVHVGTCEEYGNGPAPFRENQAPAPVSPYSAAKVAATAFVRTLCVSFGLRAVIVRPFLTYGPGQPANLLVPALIRSALEGNDFPMTPGEQTREFNFIEDVIEGMLRAGEAEGVEGEIINIGCGEPRRIRDVAALVLELMGNPVQLQLGKLSYRPGETWEFYCSNEKARDLLGWEPRTPLEDGLRRTIAWYREKHRGVRV
ncbi:MAG: NAD-dependent epimerase/dehydratase family protein [Candidatus Krumholzibacteriia bacterium]